MFVNRMHADLIGTVIAQLYKELLKINTLLFMATQSFILGFATSEPSLGTQNNLKNYFSIDRKVIKQ